MKITKDVYLERLEFIKTKQKELNAYKAKVREMYIDENKPCDIDSKVELVSAGGSVYVGKVISFSLFGTDIYIDCIHDGTKNRYLSRPARKITLINEPHKINEHEEEKNEVIG
jgi:hypothetical protein